MQLSYTNNTQNKLKLLFSEENEYHLNLVKVIVCKHAENIVLLGICFKECSYLSSTKVCCYLCFKWVCVVARPGFEKFC